MSWKVAVALVVVGLFVGSISTYGVLTKQHDAAYERAKERTTAQLSVYRELLARTGRGVREAASYAASVGRELQRSVDYANELERQLAESAELQHTVGELNLSASRINERIRDAAREGIGILTGRTIGGE